MQILQHQLHLADLFIKLPDLFGLDLSISQFLSLIFTTFDSKNSINDQTNKEVHHDEGNDQNIDYKLTLRTNHLNIRLTT